MKRAEYNKKIQEALSKAEEQVFGIKDKRVAVLGAFDTWPYMDFISRRLAKMNHTAVTSRYIYRLDKQKKIVRIDNTPDPDEFMVDFLQDKVIFKCPKAIIVYSVSGGHFIETDWCYRNHMNTLGIALVRNIGKTLSAKQCSYLKVRSESEFSLCKGSGTAWDCIESSPCPFKEQGISKNVIEYYLRAGPSKMILASVENIDNMPTLIKEWLKGDLLK
jgi:hypothetical protein